MDHDVYGVSDLLHKIETYSRELGINIKLFGSLAAIQYIKNSDDPNLRDILATYKARKALKDLDFIASGKHRGKVKKLFMEILQFEEDFHVNRLHGRRRHIYYSKDGTIHVDIYFDKFEFNHDIDVKEELERPGFVLSLPYLILTKLQITEPTIGDIIDIQVLIYVCSRNKDCSQKLEDLYRKYLSNDWGFWYDSMMNLERALLHLNIYENIELRKRMEEAIRRSLDFINNMEKGKKWIKRARISTKKEWYRKVEEPRL